LSERTVRLENLKVDERVWKFESLPTRSLDIVVGDERQYRSLANAAGAVSLHELVIPTTVWTIIVCHFYSPLYACHFPSLTVMMVLCPFG
jgi:hypothetical protein